jgi:hypothetical protein
MLLIRLAAVIFSRYSTAYFSPCFFIPTPNRTLNLYIWVLTFGCVMLHFFTQCSTVSSASAYLALQHNVSLMKITAENLQTGNNGCHGNQRMTQHSLTQSRQVYRIKSQEKYRFYDFEGGCWSKYGLLGFLNQIVKTFRGFGWTNNIPFQDGSIWKQTPETD